MGQTLNSVNVIYAVWPLASEILRHGMCLRFFHLVKACVNAFEETESVGEALGRDLIKLLGSDHEAPIHFIGHSFGALVNAHAISLLGKAELRADIQWTGLDVALHLTRGGKAALESLLGKSAPVNPVRCDNYFGMPFFSVGHPIRHSKCQIEDRGGRRVARTHCGVIDYYRSTVEDATAKRGFGQSIVKSSQPGDRGSCAGV